MSGPTEFDPYQKWLGIPSREQPPDHYCLLGLERFEEDREVIQRHANQRITQLSQHKEGPYAKVCKELLYKVSVAKACLLNPSLKPGYDRQLQDRLASRPQSAIKAAPESDADEGHAQSEEPALRQGAAPSVRSAPNTASLPAMAGTSPVAKSFSRTRPTTSTAPVKSVKPPEAVEADDDPLTEMRRLLETVPDTADTASGDDDAMDFDGRPTIKAQSGRGSTSLPNQVSLSEKTALRGKVSLPGKVSLSGKASLPRKASPLPARPRASPTSTVAVAKPSTVPKSKPRLNAELSADEPDAMASLLSEMSGAPDAESTDNLFGPHDITPVEEPAVERLAVPSAVPVATENREPAAGQAVSQAPRPAKTLGRGTAVVAPARVGANGTLAVSGQAAADEVRSSPDESTVAPEPEPSLSTQSAEMQIPRFAGYELLAPDDPSSPLAANPGYQVVAPQEVVTRQAGGSGNRFRSKLVIGVVIAVCALVTGVFVWESLTRPKSSAFGQTRVASLWEWLTRSKSSAFGQPPASLDKAKGTSRQPPSVDSEIPIQAAKAVAPSSPARRVEQPAAAAAGESVEIGVAYGTEKRTWLEWAVREFANSEEGSRIRVTLIPMGSVEGARAIVEGDTHIHVWCPASKLYREAFVRDWDAKYKGNPILREDVLALTPMVFVMWKSRYDEFLKKSPEVSLKTISFAMRAKTGWAAIAGKPEWGFFKFGLTDPNQSNSGLMTLILLAYEYSRKTSGLIGDEIRAPAFQEYMATLERGVTGLSNSTGNLMTEMVVKGPSSYDVLMVYESVVIDSIQNAETRWGDLRVVYPKLTLWNDNPYYILNAPWTTPSHQKAADAFLRFLMSEPIQLRALRHGFRPGNPAVSLKRPDSPFVRYENTGLNIDLPSVCELPSVEVIENLQQAWARFAVPR